MTTLVRRDPDRGYYDTCLWLPKKYVSQRQVQSSLTYEGRDRNIIRGWKEEEHHLLVPRNFYSAEALRKLPYQVFDSRSKSFPRVELKSTVVLDAKEPGKTYQREGCQALLETQDGILCLRCGAGKSPVALHAAAQLKVPVLIVVNEKSLALQWVREIKKFLGLADDEIGRLGGDNSPFAWEGRPIAVALIQTLARRAEMGRLPPELVRYYGVVIVDEAHITGAPKLNQGIPPFHGRRWGLSATPTRDDGYDSLLKNTVGEVVYTYLMPDLRPTVYFRKLNTRLDLGDQDVLDMTHDISGEFHFLMTYSYLAQFKPRRMDEIVKDVRKAITRGRQVLVLTHSRQMCEALAIWFPEAGVCHGGVKGKERIRRIKEHNPVIAIMQVGKQALDKESLDTLFICDPFSREALLQQTMGRVLRNFTNKKDPMVIFYEDVYIKPLRKMCMGIRRSLNKWPAHKGGRIPFRNIA